MKLARRAGLGGCFLFCEFGLTCLPVPFSSHRPRASPEYVVHEAMLPLEDVRSNLLPVLIPLTCGNIVVLGSIFPVVVWQRRVLIRKTVEHNALTAVGLEQERDRYPTRAELACAGPNARVLLVPDGTAVRQGRMPLHELWNWWWATGSFVPWF